jgi:hypothetical protein
MTEPRDFVKTLGAVIDLAVDVINRPAVVHRFAAITDLTTIVDHQRAVMVEGGNPIGGEVSMLLDALAHIEAERSIGSDRGPEFCMVAGVLLPMVRGCMLRAIALRNRRPSTSDHDFRRGDR